MPSRHTPALALVASLVLSAPAPAGPDLSGEVLYHFMPIAWRDSDGDQHRFGDFGGMTASLDYLQDLGVTGVWINPIFPSPAYHGYQHGPADQVNPWFGSEAQFLDFVRAAHDRGIKVYVDLVCYGISHNSVYYQSAHGNPASPFDPWLAFTNAANTQYQGYAFTTWNGDQVGFIHWDLRHPPARDLVIQWSARWLDPSGDGDPSDGIDGFRLDHVWPQYDSGPDGWGYNLDDFWTPWKDALRAVNPDVVTFAEQADWGSTGAPLLGPFDAAFTKPFEFAARDALVSESASRLYEETARALAELPADGRGGFLAIIGDHDVDRLASAIGGSLNKAKAAAAILLTQPFPPIIYYGDEIGMLGTKGNFGSDANDIPMREPFKWNAVAGPPMTDYWRLNAQAYNNRFSRDNDGRSVQEQLGVPGSLLETYKALIAARKANPALSRGRYIPVANSSPRVWSFLRHEPNGQTALVAINLHGQPVNPSLNLADTSISGTTTTPRDLITGATLAPITNANKAAYPVSLPAYGYRVLEAALIPPAEPPPPPADLDGVNIPADAAPAPAAATQNNATGLGDNLSELNQLFLAAHPRGLRMGLTGNLEQNGTALVLLFDTHTGGQNTLITSHLAAPPGGLAQLHGLRLDNGFAPDAMYFINTAGGSIFVDHLALPTGAGAIKTYRGRGTVGDGDGLLSGADNPHGLLVAMDNANAAGVTGASAAGASTATRGFELLIPLAELGLPADAPAHIAVAALLVRPSGEVSNQWLPGLGGGRPNLGLAPDLTAIPGQQFVLFTYCPADFDADGTLGTADFSSFRAAYLAGDPRCDYNASGSLDVGDFTAFRAAYLSGCP